MGVEAGHLHRLGRGVGGDRDERARGQVFGHLEHRLERDAAPGQRPVGQHVSVIAFMAAGDGELARAVRGDELPAEFGRAGIAQVQAVMPVAHEVVAGVRQAAAFDIGRCGAEDAAAVGDLADAQGAVLRLPQEESEVEPFARKVHVAVGEPQAQGDLGVGVQEFRDLGREQPPAQPERRGDEQCAARVFGEVHHACLGRLDRVEHLHGPLVEGPPLFGRGQAARGALEQPHAQVILELRDPRRGHGRRYPQVAPGGGHAAQFIDPNKGANVVEIGHFSEKLDTAWQYPAIPNNRGFA